MLQLASQMDSETTSCQSVILEPKAMKRWKELIQGVVERSKQRLLTQMHARGLSSISELMEQKDKAINDQIEAECKRRGMTRQEFNEQARPKGGRPKEYAKLPECQCSCKCFPAHISIL